ncbi:MAG: insulinase family protein, partial [candidate division Zixibacteria bacterium]|nr:insulinase family protein [candidate division Zixibacteria bacterium]
MRQDRTNLLSKAAVIFIILATCLAGTIWGAGTTYQLDNGMEVILKETHASPMVAGMVFVKSGSKYESRFENGITHFLEHLLFNGTVNRSREEIDGSIRDLGGYLNAFTRKDLTSYFVLMPKQHIDYGLVTMADMLFNSTIPENELLKERQVVIEEIKRSADSPGWAAEKFFTEKAFAGTNYDRPV